MGELKKLVWLIVALGLGAFALPSMGDPVNKHFHLITANGTVIVAQEDSTVLATFINDNPSGSNAQFSSLTISLADNPSGLQIVSADPDSIFGGTVSAPSADGQSISVTGISQVKAGQQYVLTVHVKGCGDGALWNGIVYSGSNLAGAFYKDNSDNQELVTNISCGLLGCGSPLGGSAVSTIIDTAGSLRGAYNQDGSCNGSTNYFVSNLLSEPEGFVHVRWDAEPAAAFFYVLKVPFVGAGKKPTLNIPNFAWKTDVNNDPVFVVGQLCDQGSSAQLPAPYGTVVSDNVGTIVVNPTAAIPKTPFAIVIGLKPSKEEYMTVTNVNKSTNTWTVTRGSPVYVHTGETVMSSPMPRLPNPVTCVDQNGNALPAASCPYTAGAPAQMCYSGGTTTETYIFDIGDGFSRP